MQVNGSRLPPLPMPRGRQLPIHDKPPQPNSQKVIPARRILVRHNSSQRPEKPPLPPLPNVDTQNKKPTIERHRYSRPTSVRSNSKGSVDSRQSSFSRQSQRGHMNLKHRVTMPLVSAKSWVVYEMLTQRNIFSKRGFKKREIASLTKIVNLITVLQLVRHWDLNAQLIRFQVSRQASLIQGTTAELKPTWEVSLYDLYFGMMLPSGNDAAYQIAQVIGYLLHLSKDGKDLSQAYNATQLTAGYLRYENGANNYLQIMNRTCNRLQLTSTHLANQHGLSNTSSYSTAQDVAKICIHAMRNLDFRNVVITKHYTCSYLFHEQQEGSQFQLQKGEMRWQNTNKMLWDGWSGIKTGITPNAGPCLAASVRCTLQSREYEFLVVLLNSDSKQHRWKEVAELVAWITQQRLYHESCS